MSTPKATTSVGPLGHSLRLFRGDRSLRHLADLLGCSHVYISEIERAENTLSAKYADKLRAMGFVDVDDCILADKLLRVVKAAR